MRLPVTMPWWERSAISRFSSLRILAIVSCCIRSLWEMEYTDIDTLAIRECERGVT
jgi:hypothetical protein